MIRSLIAFTAGCGIFLLGIFLQFGLGWVLIAGGALLVVIALAVDVPAPEGKGVTRG